MRSTKIAPRDLFNTPEEGMFAGMTNKTAPPRKGLLKNLRDGFVAGQPLFGVVPPSVPVLTKDNHGGLSLR